MQTMTCNLHSRGQTTRLASALLSPQLGRMPSGCFPILLHGSGWRPVVTEGERQGRIAVNGRRATVLGRGRVAIRAVNLYPPVPAPHHWTNQCPVD